MGKFKEFIINERVGLGDLGSQIYSKIHNQDFDNQVNGAITSMGSRIKQDTQGMSEQPPDMPANDLVIPSVEKVGRIVILHDKKNPIYLRLSDGTEAYFTYDQFKKIKGTPKIGKTMSISFQRHPEDKMQRNSKINKAEIMD